MTRKKMAEWARAFRAYGLTNKAVRRHLRCMKED